jgi:DNA-binding FadR family transcriptional regulator
MPKLRKAKKLSLVQDVATQIEDAILDGEYKPGDKLPPIRQLQEIFGASLGTIRESLAILEQKGLLEVRSGAKGGFFIREVTTKSMTESLEMLLRHMSLSPRELYEFRANLEAGIIRLVVQRATEQQIQGFIKYLDKFKVCINQKKSGWLKFIEFEQDLRKEFLKVINNRTYEAVLIPINDSLPKYAALNLPGGNREAADAYEYWEKILSAVNERDENLAADLIKKLLFHFMELIMKHTTKN